MLALAGPVALQAQVTTINVNNQVLQSPVKRLGVNLGATTFYDSAQTMKNLVINNPGFEGEIARSMIQCSAGTANSCTHSNAYSGWPNDFWDGASYQFVYGTALGRSGTVSTFTAANGTTGGVFNFSDSSTVPHNGDYMIVSKPMPGNATSGWSVYATGAGSITTNSSDLPPGTQGIQTAFVNAPTGNDSATLNYYFDSTIGHTFIQLNGQYQLTFKAKGLSAGASVGVQVYRSANPRPIYIYSTVALTNDWQTYTIPFTANENGSVIGTAQVQFYTVGADSFYLDDVSLVQLNTDPTNTTVFRDPVVNALKQLNPGVIRFWFNQLGEPLDNMLAPQLGRQRSTYSAYTTDINFIEYGLTDFLQLCQTVGAEPWVVIPITLTNAEASNLIDYLAGPASTVYGAKRAATGQVAPWTSVFNKIHLEFGNEAWDTIFNGGNMENFQAYGTRTNTVFAAMRNNSNFSAPSFDLIMNGFSAYPAANTVIQSYCTNNDSVGAAPYLMYNVKDPADAGYTGAAAIEDLFGSAFAEAEAFVTPSGTAEGVANGYILQDQLAIKASGNPKPFVSTEINVSPTGGDITQPELDSFSSSIGVGLAVVDAMLQQMRVGVLTQNLFQLAQFDYQLPVLNNQYRTTYLWGSVVDMGVSDRRRPQFLALQMANAAIATSSATMLQTVHTGADPTWYQPQVQTVQLNNAHYLQSFAFNNGSQYSLIVFNTHRTSALPVNFGGSNVPAGTVQMQQLTSTNITDTNENWSLVAPVSSTLYGFNPATPLSLPPFSMTVLTWNAPQISGVTVSGITSTSATISWNTDVAASGQVNYGTTVAYGLQAASSGASTTQSVTLSGLTPGKTYDFAVSANAGGATSSSANATFNTPGFTISAPSSITMQQGQSNSYPVTITPANSFTGSVFLTLWGVPAGGSFSFQTITSTSSTLTISLPATVPTGTYPLSLSGTSGSLTIIFPSSLVVTAPLQSQTITFSPIPSQIVGSSLTVQATASSGLPVTFSVAQNGNCSISGNVVTFLNAGNCGVVANQAGNSNYAAAPAAGQVVIVNASTPPPPGAQSCSAENGTCTIPQGTTATVYYGAGGKYLQRVFSGTFTCSTATFGGDPDTGVAKACYPVANTLPPGATGCAVDFGTCTTPAGSTAEVYYGANGIYIYRSLSGGAFSCAPSTFGGDPLYGTLKSCYPVISSPPATVTACATDGGTCTIAAGASKLVYYGASGIYLTKTLSGTFSCGATTFGANPAPTAVKSCLY